MWTNDKDALFSLNSEALGKLKKFISIKINLDKICFFFFVFVWNYSNLFMIFSFLSQM